ncbi:hypothetical protein B0I37DRAFT_433233 [Chaetomium sp. MPI-CAGE-AT-0009]|nr:hypothetical protein B0I37DRAFT_433233 [Chaetomium sp. MPI-CAGE-AT-0009]
MAPQISTDNPQRDLYFRILSYVAGSLLWGFSVLNGSATDLVLAAWTGKLNDGSPLKTSYTGLPFLDIPIAVLVAFFCPGTNGHDEGFQLFVVEAFSAFAVGFVWLHVESTRPGQKPKWITRPALWAVLWQLFGAAMILPLYFGIHLKWASREPLQKVTDVDRARALTPGFLLGVVVPTAIVMAPTWVPRSAEVHQTIVAVFMLSPFWVSGITIAATKASAWFSGFSSSPRRNKTHLYVMYRVSFPANPEVVNLTRMYLPLPPNGPIGVTDNITSGSWLFLQFDHIFISLSSLSWALLLLEKTPLQAQFGRGGLVSVLLVSALLIGPGATVSMALYFREGYLVENAKGY